MIYRVVLTAAFLVISFSTAYSELININDLPFYVKKGFSSEWINKSSIDKSWIYIPPSDSGERSMRIIDYKFEGIPKRSFLSYGNMKDEEFTFLTRFSISDKVYKKIKIPGLFLATIGINWEIYLNGKLLRKEVHRSSDGDITLSRTLRRVCIPIHPQYLKKQDNILVFRIIGNPWNYLTGFYRSKPYLIGNFDQIHESESETISLILIFLYLFIGLYHMYLYINRLSDKYNLFYGLFSIAIFIYFLSRTHSIFELLSDSAVIQVIEYVSLFSVLPLFGCFLDILINEKISLFTKILSIIYSLLIGATIFVPAPIGQDLLLIWQYTVIIPLIYLLVIVLGKTYAINTIYLYRIYKSKKASFSLIRSIISSLFKTIPGNLLIGLMIGVGGMIYDIIDALYFSTGLMISRYSFLIITIGVMLVLTNRFQSIFRQNEVLNINLKNNIFDLNEANAQIKISEEKYRSLVEETKDPIFSLDDKYNFITANKIMGKILGISNPEFKKMNFFNIIYDSSDDRDFSIHLIEEKLEELLNTKRSVQFKAEFKSAFRIEPIEMHVRLEYIGTEGKHEILGKAIYLIEDVLAKSFISEEQKYVIGNSLIAAEELSRRITRNLYTYLEHKKVPIIRIAIREMIINAIEHGNLNISFDEKTIAVQDKKYTKLISERREDDRYKNKKITLEYKINPKSVRYIITDEGDGFDHEKIMNEIDKANREMLSHGRGIMMAKSIFDEIIYNKKGNQVTLTMKFADVI